MKIKVSKSFGEKRVLDNLELLIKDHEIVAIIGVSGSGKTTLLNIISGNLEYDGEIVEAPKSVSYVFQTARLMPWATVADNLDFVLPKHIKKPERQNKIDNILREVELIEDRDNYPDSLSGGMAQRVALARAFIVPQDILLMDEPFKGLDVRLRNKLLDTFKNLWSIDKRTTLIVTHDVDEAMTIADRVVILDQGKIQKEFDTKDISDEDKIKVKEEIIALLIG